MFSQNTLWIIGGAIIAVVLAALAGWIFFLQGEQSAVTRIFEGRGFDGSVPTFDGATGGSTNKNIQEGILEDFGLSSPTSSEAEQSEKAQTPRLWQLSSVPAAGVTTLGTSTVRIQFTERPSGHIFEANPQTGSITRISNTLVPQTFEADWGAGEQIFLRHLDEDREYVMTFSGHIQATTTESSNTLRGTYLEPDIVSLTPDPETGEVFTLIRTAGGVVGILAQADGSEPKRVFESTLTGWRSFRAGNIITLVQKAAEGVAGSSFTLTPDGKQQLLISNITGLTVRTNRENTAYLYGQTYQDAVELFAHGPEESTRKLSIKTFAEKCAFDPTQEFVAYCAVPNNIPGAQLPDAWYRGEVHFSDSWWKVDTQEGRVEQVFSPESEFGTAVDVRDPHISADGSYIVFLDARTRAPWAFRIQN